MVLLQGQWVCRCLRDMLHENGSAHAVVHGGCHVRPGLESVRRHAAEGTVIKPALWVHTHHRGWHAPTVHCLGHAPANL